MKSWNGAVCGVARGDGAVDVRVAEHLAAHWRPAGAGLVVHGQIAVRPAPDADVREEQSATALRLLEHREVGGAVERHQPGAGDAAGDGLEVLGRGRRVLSPGDRQVGAVIEPRSARRSRAGSVAAGGVAVGRARGDHLGQAAHQHRVALRRGRGQPALDDGRRHRGGTALAHGGRAVEPALPRAEQR